MENSLSTDKQLDTRVQGQKRFTQMSAEGIEKNAKNPLDEFYQFT